MTISLIVDSVIRVPVASIPPKALETLWAKLQFPNPQYVRAVRFGRVPTDMPRTIQLIEPGPDDTWLIPRGAVGVVREAFAAADEGIRFDDRRVTFPPVDFEMRLVPRDYQVAAAQALHRHHQAIAVGPPGLGKSILALEAVRLARQPALFMMRTRALVEQWCEGIERVLGRKPGRIGDGQCSPDILTVATTQALSAMDDAALAELLARFGTVVVDEAHSCAAPTDRRILNLCAGQYRFGVTATPEREDGLGPMLELVIGPIVYRIAHQKLVDSGHLVAPRIEAIATGCGLDAETHTELVSALADDDDRNRLIVNLVAREVQAGHCVLVLSGRVEHCDRLAAMLREADVGAESLTSQVTRTRRTEILARFRSGELPVLTATSLADEGLDVPRLDRLVLATPARAEGRTIQRLGRLMRPHAGKGVPVLFDLVDDAPLARKQFAARRAAYRKVLGGAPSAGAPSATPPREAARRGGEAGGVARIL